MKFKIKYIPIKEIVNELGGEPPFIMVLILWFIGNLFSILRVENDEL
jgi:hypothetical protein